MPEFSAILLAAGKSTRFADQNYKKPFAPLAGKAVWLHSAEKFLARDDVKQLILVIAKEDREYFDFKFSSNIAILGIEVVEGGTERYESVEKALARVKQSSEYVIVHDAARPCLADEWITKVSDAAIKSGAAILAMPIAGTIKRVDPRQQVIETVSREALWEAQTPQVFRRQLLLDAYARRGQDKITDDAQAVEKLGHPVTVVQGSPVNLKVTTKEDLRLAEQAIKALPKRATGPLHPFADDELWR